MKLFIAFGSWGEIAPLLEIALQLQDRGESVAFLTTDDWAMRVKAYGVRCFTIPTVKHESTPDAFLRAYILGRTESLYETIAIIDPSSIVSAFFCFPAAAYAEKHGVQLVFTNVSPHYLGDVEVPAFRECVKEAIELGVTQSQMIVGLFPWYLSLGQPTLGYPELRPLAPLPQALLDFMQGPYGVVTRGTAIEDSELNRMVNAIKAHGLKCLYLGRQECDADLSLFVDDHKAAISKAAVTINQAGVGTLVDCMGSPMVVDPKAYDQFYNAQRMIELQCAVPVNGSYIKAVGAAMKPRSYLPNSFSLDDFLGVTNEYPSRDARRHAADVGELAQIH